MNVETAIQEIKTIAERDYFPWVVEQVVIETPEQLKNSSDLLAIGKRLEKDAATKLAEITAPIMAEEQAARAAFRPLISRIHLGWSRIDDAIITYHRKIKAEADALLAMQAAEMKAKQQAAEALQIQQMLANAQAAEEAKETGEVFEPVEITPMPEPEALIVEQVKPLVRGNMGSTSIRDVPEFMVINEALVPNHLKTVDMKKVAAYYKAGVTDIPGIMVTIKQRTVSRFS